MNTDAEKSRSEQKPSELKAKKKQGGKTAGTIFSVAMIIFSCQKVTYQMCN